MKIITIIVIIVITVVVIIIIVTTIVVINASDHLTHSDEEGDGILRKRSRKY